MADIMISIRVNRRLQQVLQGVDGLIQLNAILRSLHILLSALVFTKPGPPDHIPRQFKIFGSLPRLSPLVSKPGGTREEDTLSSVLASSGVQLHFV